MIKTVFLLAIFSGGNITTTTHLTPMPNMEVCKKAEKVLYDVVRKGEVKWGVDISDLPIKKPIKTECIEL